MTLPSPDHPDAYGLGVDDLLSVFVDDHREMLARSLDGLSEGEARRQLVPSSTTLLGLVKHATFVERVWFDEAVSGVPRLQTGIATDPEASFKLSEEDTIDSVLTGYQGAVANSREVVARLGVDAIVNGNRRGPLPLRWVLLHVLRELAQHCGHADILREQLLAARETDQR